MVVTDELEARDGGRAIVFSYRLTGTSTGDKRLLRGFEEEAGTIEEGRSGELGAEKLGSEFDPVLQLGDEEVEVMTELTMPLWDSEETGFCDCCCCWSSP